MNSNIRNLITLTLVNGVMAASGMLTMVKMTNVIGIKTFGMYSFAMAVSMYGSTLVRYGRERNMVRNLVQNPAEQNVTIAGTVILGSVILTILSLMFGLYVLFVDPSLGIGVLLVCIATSMLAVDLQPVYDSWGKMGRHAIYLGMARFFQYAVLWVFFLAAPSRLTLTHIGIIMVLSSLIFLGIQYAEVLRITKLTIVTRENVRNALSLLSSNFTVALAVFLSLAFGPTLQILIKELCDVNALGIYSVAWQCANIGIFLLLQIGRIGNPSMARLAKPDVSTLKKCYGLSRYLGVLIFASAPVAIPAIFYPKAVITALFNTEYWPAAQILPLFGLYILLYPVAIVACQYVISCRLERAYLISVLCGSIMGVVSGTFLVLNYGIWGGALALLLSHSVTIIMNVITVIRSLEWNTG